MSGRVGREREVDGRERDDDLAVCGVGFALVVLIADFDELGWEGFEEPFAERDWWEGGERVEGAGGRSAPRSLNWYSSRRR